MTTPLRILHIFAFGYKKRFGGPIFDWKYAFSKWDDPAVEHYVLDYDQKKIISAEVAFDFEFPESQVMSTRKERTLWIFSLLQNLRKFKHEYDIIHFHVLWWGGLLAATWAKLKKIPTLYQSVLENSDTPSGVINQAQGQLKFKLLQNFSAILAISPSLAENYLQYGFQKEKVFTLLNSVDTEFFYPISSPPQKIELRLKQGLPLTATILLFVGSIIHRKGVDTLIQSFIDLSKLYSNLYLLIVGPKSLNENPSLDIKFINGLSSLLTENSIDHRVKFFGLVTSRNELADLYRLSDIFVFPSRNEGLGNVVLEAMASGLPVVISDLPPLKRVVLDGINGKVVPIDNSQKLSFEINYLINNPDSTEQLGMKAREYILKNLTFSSWQKQMSKIYHSLILSNKL